MFGLLVRNWILGHFNINFIVTNQSSMFLLCKSSKIILNYIASQIVVDVAL